jgi:hypothetical protein
VGYCQAPSSGVVAARCAESNRLTPECLRATAKLAGLDENNPALVRAVEVLEKWRSGTFRPEEFDWTFAQLDVALSAFCEACGKK